MTARVSIITPSYNQGVFIERTIQSVLQQDIDEVEYVVVDGGSTDQTLAILEQYRDRLHFVSEKDKGQADAVNKGLAMTTGEVIGWLNSDDIYYSDTLKTVCDFFEHHPDVDVVYGQSNEIASDDSLLQLYPTEHWNLERLKVNCFISQPATFFRRRMVTQCGPLDTTLNFCLDYEYWLRLGLKQAKFTYLPQVLAGSRIHDQTKSTRFYLAAHEEAVHMLQRKLGAIPSDWIVNYSTAKTKIQKKRYFPDPRFIFDTWLNTWEVAGLYNTGIKRFAVWMQAQFAMLKKII